MRLLPNVKPLDTKPQGACNGELIQNAKGQALQWLDNQGFWVLCEKDLSPKEQEEEAALGMRFNKGKTRFDLIPSGWTRVLAQILTVGAAKYAPRNWEKGLSWSETLGSLHRHLDSWVSGEMYDPETKCHHLGHVAWNALALMSMQLRGVGTEDIPETDIGTMEEED